jgi:hypothetical protein
MPNKTAKTADEYIAALPADRRPAIANARKLVKTRLPKGYVEHVDFGMKSGRYVHPEGRPHRLRSLRVRQAGRPGARSGRRVSSIGNDSTYGIRNRDEFTSKDYHQPSDEVKPDWDLSGGMEDGRALFKVGYIVAQRDAMPERKSGNEFKARRDSMMTRK